MSASAGSQRAAKPGEIGLQTHPVSLKSSPSEITCINSRRAGWCPDVGKESQQALVRFLRRHHRATAEARAKPGAVLGGRVGVTQSGGSRYESGRNVPKAVQTLLQIAYGTDAEAAAVVSSLRQVEPPYQDTKRPATASPHKRERPPVLPKGFGYLP